MSRGKRAMDICALMLLAPLLSPVILAIAVAVFLDSPGPVFYRAKRIGRGGRPFEMLKFRTMRIGLAGRSLAGAGDPRITPLGRALRNSRLDELPQLWNVMRGEMSLVGPRPPLAYEVEQYQAWHCRRVRDAKPGITGLWQVKGRSRTTFDEMVRLDLRYAKARSLWLDVKILLATPRAVIGGKGAC
ncbi:MAG TPA: sugar transferase [Solirubrobacterales bacterium]|nr:sugar transferase [Solirubrobacterales bacterium]